MKNWTPRDFNMTTYLESKKLTACPNIKHGFFNKFGGVSDGPYATLNCRSRSDDDREKVEKNRMIACNMLSKNAELFEIRQVHSPHVHKFDGHKFNDQFIVPEADAAVTNKKNIALSVVTADCAPVLLADPVANVIGAAHAGWKGAHSGIIENTVAAMVEMGASRENITASIGPCIAQTSYEVGPELYKQISNENYFTPSQRENHYMFDLEGYVSDKLWQSEITKIDPLHTDTYDENNNLFSYRRRTHSGESDYGCQISIILQQ